MEQKKIEIKVEESRGVLHFDIWQVKYKRVGESVTLLWLAYLNEADANEAAESLKAFKEIQLAYVSRECVFI